MRKLILLGALVLSSCGYYTAPRDERFINQLYIGMSVAKLEAVAAQYRGIKIQRVEGRTSQNVRIESHLCSTELPECFPQNIYEHLQFEPQATQFIVIINGEEKILRSRGVVVANPAIEINMGGSHGFFLGKKIHIITAYFNEETGEIIGFVNGYFMSDITYAHFPVDIQ
ncbi:MAG: hypothetical protein COB08_001390 [Rhodobacteraceae bacterium]|nr:hypothetical protein [Paracoccaceae bacterium]